MRSFFFSEYTFEPQRADIINVKQTNISIFSFTDPKEIFLKRVIPLMGLATTHSEIIFTSECLENRTGQSLWNRKRNRVALVWCSKECYVRQRCFAKSFPTAKRRTVPVSNNRSALSTVVRWHWQGNDAPESACFLYLRNGWLISPRHMHILITFLSMA